MLRAFLADRRGTVAIAFSLSALPMLMAIGVAADYSVAMRGRSDAQQAADAAALAASRAAADYLAANGYSSSTVATAKSRGITAAENTFAANSAGLADLGTATMTPTMTITSTQNITADVGVEATIPTSFLNAIGVQNWTLAASSQATATLPVAYYQFVFLVDVSGSMAIGGTPSDISTLQASSQFGNCGFACHDPNHYYGSTDYRVLAKNKGIKLKIDYVNTAMQTFLSSLQTALTKAGANATVSIYTFGTSFKTVLSSTSNLNTAITSAAAVDVEGVGTSSQNWGYTYTSTGLTSLRNTLRNVGDGTSSSSRKTYVVFITDGVQDVSPGCSVWGRCTDVSYGTGCSAIKNLGATMISIETVYPSVPNDTQYSTIVRPLTSQLQPTMSACASGAQWYFSASDGPGIQAAMGNAVVNITNTLRIVQ